MSNQTNSPVECAPLECETGDVCDMIGCREALAAPSASAQQAHVDLTGLADRLLAPREIVRDEYGHLYNPAFPILDEGDDVRMFLGAFGIELCQVSMESDCDDEALCEAVWAGEKGCGEWVPTTPEGEGWLLSDIFDTEDGPYALFIRRRPKEPKKSRRERYVAAAPFQARVQPWMLECFGAEIAADQQERNHRFLEEALELVQSCGATASEAHQLVDYVYGRPVGDKHQEAGGVMVTLAALCLAQGLDMHAAGETELTRIWTKVEQIRAKQAAKPKHSPLPEHVPAPAAARIYPLDLTPALHEVLSLMLWHTGPMAHVLRAGGAVIKTRAEDEQAHVLHWLIQVALEHGEAWRERAGDKIREIQAALRASKEGA